MLEFYEDSTNPKRKDTISLPNSFEKNAGFVLYEGKFVHGQMFVFFNKKKSNQYAVLKYTPETKEKNWILSLDANTVNEWFVPLPLRIYEKNFRYEAFWIRDSSKENFFINKRKWVPDEKNFLRYEKVWQYDFKNRKVSDIKSFGVFDGSLLLNVYINKGEKMGWWALAIDDKTGNIKYYKRLTYDTDTIINRVYCFSYDTLLKQYYVVTGRKHTIKNLIRNKIFQFTILDSSMEIVRTWTVYTNINLKKLKEYNIEKAAPMNFMIKTISEVEYQFSSWGWGLKNGYFFPVCFFSKNIHTEQPSFKISIISEPQNNVFSELNLSLPNKFFSDSTFDFNSFSDLYPHSFDSVLHISMVQDNYKKNVFVLKANNFGKFTFPSFDIKEKFTFESNMQIIFFENRNFIWLVNASNGGIFFSKRKYIK
ncbi:MAG: hypothetical protein N3F09_03445 [Bacteroidia bacterium]|nr:hypothetical protein [Bacteroidia bacterium]